MVVDSAQHCTWSLVEMVNPLTMKLEQFAAIEQGDRERLEQLLAYPTETFARGETILPEGKKVRQIHLVLRGLAARSKTLKDGRRQTMALLIPGDLCDIEVFVLQAMDHDIIAMSDTTCVQIPAAKIEAWLTEGSSLTKALWWGTMLDSAILREWIVGHGARDAREQIAHLCYELLIRYRIVGEAADNTVPFPLTQSELGEATGITPVHANRVLKELREDGLMDIKSRTLTVLDPKGLRRAANYDPAYLHLLRTEARDHLVSHRASDLVPASAHAIASSALSSLKGRFSH
jgi:CRP-like cAMP-binding protein